MDRLDTLDGLDRLDTLDGLDRLDTLDKKNRIGHYLKTLSNNWTDIALIYKYITIFCPVNWTLCPRGKKLDTITVANCPILHPPDSTTLILSKIVQYLTC